MKKRRGTIKIGAVLATLIALAFLCGLAEAATVRTVALAGDFPAGTPKVLTVDSLSAPQINDLGLTSFITVSDDPSDLLSLRSFWSEEAGGLRLVASDGDDAPLPEGGIKFQNVLGGAINELGESFLATVLTGTGVNNSNNFAVWIEDAGLLQLVARSGDPVPGFADDVVFGPFQPGVVGGATGFNAAGQLLLMGGIAGSEIDSSNNFAIFLGDRDSLRLIAQKGDQAPGMPASVTLLTVLPALPGDNQFGAPLNDAGQSVLNVALTEDGVTPSGTAVYVGDTASFRLVAMTGDAAEGLPDGVEFQFIRAFGIDAAGQTAFYGAVQGPGIDATNNTGIWSETGDVASLVARVGDPAPGTDPGVTFSTFRRVTVGYGGDVVFKASLSGPGVVSGDSLGIWSDAGGTLDLIVRSGDQAPGMPVGMVFQQFDLGLTNAAGQVSMVGVVGDNPSTPGDWEVGIWATDSNGELQLIVGVGDELEVAPGVFRTIERLDIGDTNPDAEGIPSGFNTFGELAFLALFTDGTQGIFVSDRAAVGPDDPPEILRNSDPGILWPPNHKIAHVDVELLASDDRTPLTDLFETLVVTISSNEPDSVTPGDPSGDVHGFDGFTAPVDVSHLFQLNDDTGLIEGTIDLRAERQGSGLGRTYSLEATIADGAGNESRLFLVFPVPHDLGAVHEVAEP